MCEFQPFDEEPPRSGSNVRFTPGRKVVYDACTLPCARPLPTHSCVRHPARWAKYEDAVRYAPSRRIDAMVDLGLVSVAQATDLLDNP